MPTGTGGGPPGPRRRPRPRPRTAGGSRPPGPRPKSRPRPRPAPPGQRVVNPLVQGPRPVGAIQELASVVSLQDVGLGPVREHLDRLAELSGGRALALRPGRERIVPVREPLGTPEPVRVDAQ